MMNISLITYQKNKEAAEERWKQGQAHGWIST